MNAPQIIDLVLLVMALAIAAGGGLVMVRMCFDGWLHAVNALVFQWLFFRLVLGQGPDGRTIAWGFWGLIYPRTGWGPPTRPWFPHYSDDYVWVGKPHRFSFWVWKAKGLHMDDRYGRGVPTWRLAAVFVMACALVVVWPITAAVAPGHAPTTVWWVQCDNDGVRVYERHQATPNPPADVKVDHCIMGALEGGTHQ